MRRIALTLALLTAAPAGAWEFPQNPDRFPSAAIGMRDIDFAQDEKQDDRGRVTGRTAFKVSVRLPLSNRLTLDTIYEDIAETRAESMGNRTQGHSYGFDLRFYFNR